MKKRIDPDHLFNFLKLNKWFAIVSVLLLFSILGMIQKDYNREWKQWQKKYKKLEIAKTQSAIDEQKTQLESSPEYKEALAQHDGALKTYKTHEAALFELQKDLNKADEIKFKVDQTYRSAKSELDALRYTYEETRHHKEKRANKDQNNLRKKEAQVALLQQEKDKTEKTYNAISEKILALTQEKEAAESALTKLKFTLSNLESKSKKLKRSFLENILRDAPMLDFIDPSMKVKEIIVDDLYDDYNFAKIKRVDSCTTCHVAIDQPGYEDQQNPLKTHPDLKTFLSSSSKHPIGEYGCTVCHSGMGGGITFTNAGHTPQTAEQGKAWAKKYHWHALKHWDDPMLALNKTEANCQGCHKAGVDVPGSKRMNQAITLVQRSGCTGCHKIDGWHTDRKAGPPLNKITSKVSKEWLTKWIRDPKKFRPTTAMPKFFDLTNTSDTTSKMRSTAQVEGIVKYLTSKATPFTPSNVPHQGGDPEQGKRIFGEVGCLGCHTMDDFPAEKVSGFGPDLSQVGSKLSPQWLAAWIKNPKEYFPQTRMPSLRTSDTEIRHLVAYLMTKKNPEFEAQTLPTANAFATDAIAMEFMKSRYPTQEAKEKVASMSQDEKLMFVGEKTIAHYGCYGCHDISGFEDAKPIGVELTLEGSKPLVRFDFGFVDAPKTVEGWINQKLKDPRIWDNGKEKSYLDKTRMPQFNFTEEEADLVTMFVLGQKKVDAPVHRTVASHPYAKQIKKGRALVYEYNCRGCHTIEGDGGTILSRYEDASQGPPNLASEGSKVQPNWLYHFFKNPSTIRPWLKIRMPSFGLSDEENNALIEYFRGLEHQTTQHETTPSLAKSGDHFKLGQDTFNQYQCLNCHKNPPYPAGTDLSNLAPPLTLLPNRLRYEWVARWLKNPDALMPGTRMPGFFYADGQPMFENADEQISAVRDYLFVHYGK